ncbi:MAG: hypothetical protein ACXVI6_09165 [Candidatus Aminicenantales bacterium]
MSTEENGKYAAGAALALDKYRGDQVIGLSYNDDNGNRIVGFNIWDQPAASQRVFVGRSNDRSANVTLIDANSRPRLRLVVGPDGDARIEFLDAAGKVTHTFPAPAGSSNK